MMKKNSILGLSMVLVFLFTGFSVMSASVLGEPAQEKQENYDAGRQEIQYEKVIKTYFLKYIEPEELLDAAKLYILDATAHKNTISVTMYKRYVPDLENLIKKLDVEKKSILFKVYTVIASREKLEQGEVIENKDLKRVLGELENLWKFKSYKLDGPSFLTLEDGSGENFFRLVSTSYNFELYIRNVNVKGDQGERIVSVDKIMLRQILNDKTSQTLMNTENVSLKEKGYLVAGVSGIGTSGKALILIINAEIK